jgi:hypothetical protein
MNSVLRALKCNDDDAHVARYVKGIKESGILMYGTIINVGLNMERNLTSCF